MTAQPGQPHFTAATISGPTDNFTNVATPGFTGTTEANATVEVDINGLAVGTVTADGLGVWTYTSDHLTDNPYTIAVIATGHDGIPSLASSNFAFTIDTIPPDNPTTLGPFGEIHLNAGSTQPTFDWAAVFGADHYVLSIDGGSPIETQATSYTPSLLQSFGHGSHTWQVSVVDKAGNVPAPSNPAPIETFFIDSLDPDTTITQQPNAHSNSASATFNFTGQSNNPGRIVGFDYLLDGSLSLTFVNTGTVTLSGLSEGSHTFKVYAQDQSGAIDTTPATYTWDVDTIAPEVTAFDKVDASPTKSGTVQFHIAFSEPVLNVDAALFSVSGTAATGASVTSLTPVAGTDDEYIVTVATGPNDGTLSLTLDGASVTDGVGNDLVPPNPSSAYVMDKTVTAAIVIDHHLVEAANGNPGVASATAAITKDGDASYDTAALAAGGWSNFGAGHWSHASTYGTATLDTIANTLTFVLDNAAADSLNTNNHPTAPFTVPLIDLLSNTTSTVATFFIDGTNDAPVVTSNGGGVTAAITVPENSTAVTTVHATDVDSPTLTYAIVGGADQVDFHIDPAAGALSFVLAPNFDYPTDSDGDNHYVVQVGASDGALSTTQTITVEVAAVPDVHQPVPVDFNHDGTSDIFSVNDNGTTRLLQINGLAQSASAFGPPLTSGQHVAGVGDFDGDGKADLLIGQDDGTVIFDKMDGASVVSSTPVTTLLPGWHVEGVADFDGDGKADILFQNDGIGALWTSLMNGATIVSGGAPGALTNGYHIAAVADFDADGKSDILYENTSGQLWLNEMDGATVKASGPVTIVQPGWHIAAAADFDGDGKADLLLRNDDGRLWMSEMDSFVIKAGAPVTMTTPDWHIDGAGDYNADGKADILWQNDSGALWISRMDGATITGAGAPGAIDPSAHIASVHSYDFV